MNKFLGWTSKVALGVCLALPMQTIASEADKIYFGKSVQVGDTIAGMTVTQASVDDVDRLMADMIDAKTLTEIAVVHSTLMTNMSSEFCQRHQPELGVEIQQAVNEWTNEVNPKLYRALSENAELNTPLSDKELIGIASIMRNMSLMIYLGTEERDNPDDYCLNMIQQLETINVDNFVDEVKSQYESYL